MRRIQQIKNIISMRINEPKAFIRFVWHPETQRVFALIGVSDLRRLSIAN